MKEDWNKIINKKYILNNVRIKLFNKEFNEEILDKIIYFGYFDLIAACCVVDEKREASFLVTHNILDTYNITIKEIVVSANSNTESLRYDFTNIAEILGEFGLYGIDSPMTVVTNESKLFGAAAMLYPQLFVPIADRVKSNLYILPSSIHELIVIPCTSRLKIDELKEMVREVNKSSVSPQERLSDSVYIFDREKERIVVA